MQFLKPSYTSNPFPSTAFPYEHVEGLAPAKIYFGNFYQQTHPLNIYGSGNSTYNVVSGPVDMKLYQGAGSNTTIRTTPMTVVGGNLVTLLMSNFLSVPSYVGTPEIYVQQDPANPAPISIVAERTDQFSQANFRLESTGNGMMRLADRATFSPFNDYWRLNYKGSDATVSINYGTITVSDTGSLGTTVSSKASAVNVWGTTGLLKILPVGTATGTPNIVLGNSGNMQAILGNVEVTPVSTSGPGSADDRNDTGHRDVHISHVSNVLTVTGLAPGTIKYFSQFAPTLYGSGGGTTFYLDNIPTYTSFFNINGGSSANDVLVGPDTGTTFNTWGNNYGNINTIVIYNSMESLRGGAGNDTFQFTSNAGGGNLSGSIDGGGGTDTLSYENSSWWHQGTYDLSLNKAPRVAGTTTSIERAPFDVLATGSKTNPIGATITPITMTKFGGPTSVTWSASNLPTGLSINPQTGVISGTLTAQTAGNKTVIVSATDGTYGSSTGFTWTVQGPTMTNPGTQTTPIGSTVNLALTATGPARLRTARRTFRPASALTRSRA